jgi:hypothetical protein
LTSVDRASYRSSIEELQCTPLGPKEEAVNPFISEAVAAIHRRDLLDEACRARLVQAVRPLRHARAAQVAPLIHQLVIRVQALVRPTAACETC